MRDAGGTVHEYSSRVVWDGNTGQGTTSYDGYGRRFRVVAAGKPELAGSADASFRGEADKHNPEDLFVAAIAACHMLFYLALCARRGIRVLAYEDQARGRMVTDARGGGRFAEVVLRPTVAIASAEHVGLATALHQTAHELCFIANSCSAPIRLEPEVRVSPAFATTAVPASPARVEPSARMKDVAIALEDRPGSLAELGEALGRAGISIEGGGAFVVDGLGVAHFLFAEDADVRRTLEASRIRVLAEREVVVQRLNQAESGQLGKLSRRMAEARVNIEALYSDHEHQLILVVDDVQRARAVSQAWTLDRASRVASADS